jgi:TolA-binding protein
MAQKDLISRLADRGEEVLAKFAETPGAARVVELLNSTRERLDDLQKRVMGLENLERRLDELEQRIDRMDSGTATAKPSGGKASSGTATAPKKAAPKKPSAESNP